MRIFIYGIVLAALAMFSGCEAVLPQEEFSSEGLDVPEVVDSVIFSASLDSQTKANLVWSEDSQTLKTIWSSGDVIQIFDKNKFEWVTFEIIEGAGTTSAKFVGSIQKQDVYVAVYGSEPQGNDSWVQFEISQKQWNEYSTCPMVAYSSSTRLNFKNMCSVLCVSLTGNGEEVYRVGFRSRSDFAPCCIYIEFNNGEPDVSWLDIPYYHIIYNFSCATLSSTPTDYYFVIPYGSYEDGFDLYVETNVGTMTKSTSEDIVFERSQLRRVVLEFEL